MFLEHTNPEQQRLLMQQPNRAGRDGSQALFRDSQSRVAER